MPTLAITLVYHAIVAFYCWTQYSNGLILSYALAAGVSALLVAVGGWCLLFASTEGRISRSEFPLVLLSLTVISVVLAQQGTPCTTFFLGGGNLQYRANL